MYIHGQFRNKIDEVISVHFLKGQDNEEKIIEDNGKIFFSSSPVQIKTSIDDTFEHIIKRECTINLVTSEYLGEYLFSNKDNDVKVEVINETRNKVLFAGYVEPQIYSQSYAKNLEELEISCLDYLGILQYGYLSDGSTYDLIKINANIRTFHELLVNKLGLGSVELDFINNQGSSIYYDQSKKVSTGNIFREISISESLFLGEDEEDIMTNEEILYEILRYLNLHIIQIGKDFYIYDWESIKTKDSISWLNIITDTETVEAITVKNVVKADYADSDTNISLAESYNQVSVKCDLDAIETVIESPLDSNKLENQFGNKQKYMSEIFSDGSGSEAYNSFKALVTGQSTNYNASGVYEHFIQVKKNPNWKFYYNGQDLYEMLLEKDPVTGEYINQHKFGKFLREHNFASCLCAFGRSNLRNQQDNSPIASLSMEDSLVISVNGNWQDTENKLNSWTTDIESKMPIVEYLGANSGIYSPQDEATTNYLVFDGKICLVPLYMQTSNRYHSFSTNGYEQGNEDCYSTTNTTFKWVGDNIDNVGGECPFYGDNDYGRYYIFKFWEQEKSVKGTPVYNSSNYSNMYVPYIDLKGIKEFYFEYSEAGDDRDLISKVPILECELKIGDKYCVEEYVGEGVTKDSVYHWYTYEECPSYVDDVTGQTVKKTTFSLGINPKWHDYIVGSEYNIQTNFDYTYNIDAKSGTAIPMKASDRLSGAVSFKILGLCNSTWKNITRVHPTFFRHTDWEADTKSILSHLGSVMIKSFECKIFSDNGGYALQGENDLVYVSDENNRFIKKKDDITFKISTALTSTEANALEMPMKTYLNSAISSSSNMPLSSITNNLTNETDKPEKFYVDAYYREYSSPKLMFNSTLHDNQYSLFKRFRVNYMGKTFFPIKYDYDLKLDEINAQLKEI